jgi:hydroxymethylpyrimidine pyrophosphatase-like HAD family hydrolase
MALPIDVTKATGLREALRRLGVTPAETVGIGDAENDEDFLRICGLSVAVANALPSVKALVDRVTVGTRGTGVEELVHQLVSPMTDNLS